MLWFGIIEGVVVVLMFVAVIRAIINERKDD